MTDTLPAAKVAGRTRNGIAQRLAARPQGRLRRQSRRGHPALCAPVHPGGHRGGAARGERRARPGPRPRGRGRPRPDRRREAIDHPHPGRGDHRLGDVVRHDPRRASGRLRARCPPGLGRRRPRELVRARQEPGRRRGDGPRRGHSAGLGDHGARRPARAAQDPSAVHDAADGAGVRHPHLHRPRRLPRRRRDVAPGGVRARGHA